MEKQFQTNSDYQNKHWLDTAETIAVGVSIAGSITSIFVKEIIVASAPLTACVAFNLMNRKRLLSLMSAENHKAIATVSQQQQNDHKNIDNQITQLSESVNNQHTKHEIDYKNLSQKLEELSNESTDSIKKLNTECAELGIKINSLSQIQGSGSNNVSESVNSAESLCQNGIAYERLGEKEKAIEEYSQAIKIDSRCALAHLNRGLLYAEAGNDKKAVENLRKAAKFFFEQGDLDGYQKTKNMSLDIHKLDSSAGDEAPNQVLANSLFS